MDTEVAIVGAGLAGLRCAQVLSASGIDVRIFEASDRVGGRVASDLVDGFIIDRGFQLLNTAYPALRRSVDLRSLDLCAFDRGVRLEHVGSRRLLLDPREGLLCGPRTIRNLPGTFREKFQLGRTLARIAMARSPYLPEPERPTAQWFAESGFSGPLVDEILQPFLAGVTLDPSLSSSSTLTALILRSLLRGRAAVPAHGMGALPKSMAKRIPSGSILLD
ncbi:MAG: FAD-dependent oxidoreductase, partial [Actinomycetota bacterium]